MNIRNGLVQKNSSVPESPAKSLQRIISSKGMEAQLRAALPSVITPERFTRLVLTAISTTPKLAKCTQKSFFGAIFQAAQLGLTPKLTHKPTFGGNRGEPVAVYAVYHTKKGGYGMEVMGWDEALEFGRKKSMSFNNGPWKTDPEEMAKKTVVKKLLKYAPISADFARAMAADETVKNFDPAKDKPADLLDEENVLTIDTDTPQDQPEPDRERPPEEPAEEDIPMDDPEAGRG